MGGWGTVGGSDGRLSGGYSFCFTISLLLWSITAAEWRKVVRDIVRYDRHNVCQCFKNWCVIGDCSTLF